MAVALTDAFLRSVTPPATGRDEYSDTLRQGLRLRVLPSGRRTWMYEKRVRGGVKRKHTLGTYPGMSIKGARATALEIQVEAERGVDRILVTKEAERERKRTLSTQLTVRDVLQLHDEIHCSTLASRKERMRSLNEVLAPFMEERLEDLDRATLQSIVDNKAKSGAPVQANRIAAYLSKFSKFAWQRGYQTEHIGHSLEKPAKEMPRDRVLTLDEMRKIHRASYECGPLWGPILRLLIATLQRRHQIGGLIWREVDFDAQKLTFGVGRTKNNEWNHFVDLPSSCVHELRSLKQLAEQKWGSEGLLNRHVFTTTGTTPSSGYSSFKTILDEVLGPAFEHWTFHDLRTGFATVMCEAGASEVIVDRILNHAAVSSAPSAVARIYNRAKGSEARRKVIIDWYEMLTEFVPDERNSLVDDGLDKSSDGKPLSLQKRAS
jgi:integrase